MALTEIGMPAFSLRLPFLSWFWVPGLEPEVRDQRGLAIVWVVVEFFIPYRIWELRFRPQAYQPQPTRNPLKKDPRQANIYEALRGLWVWEPR